MGLREDILEMKKEVKEVKKDKEQSYAMEILHDYKKANKRQFITILVILFMWFSTIGYLIYILNDIGIETTTTESYDIMQDIDDINTIEGSIINRGK